MFRTVVRKDSVKLASEESPVEKTDSHYYLAQVATAKHGFGRIGGKD